jgi:hypothetical protein
MSETASNTFEITPAGSTGQQLFDAILAVFNSTEWSSADTVPQTWQVDLSEASYLVLGLAENSGGVGPKIYIEAKTTPQNSLFVRYDPTGEIVGGAYTPSSTASPLVNFTGQNVASSGVNTIYIAQYSDAIMIHFDTGLFFKYMIHAGIVMAPDNASDPDIFIDGSGLVVGQPGVSAGAANSAFFVATGTVLNTTGQQSYVRIGETRWGQMRLATNDYLPNGVETADVNGRVRLVPMLVRAITNVTKDDALPGTLTISGELGRTRYLRFYKQSPTHRSVLPSRDTLSQQAWLGWSHGSTGATVDNVLGLWRKDDPTIVTLV